MRQVWLLVAFVLVMLLIAYGWQGEAITATPADGGATARSLDPVKP